MAGVDGFAVVNVLRGMVNEARKKKTLRPSEIHEAGKGTKLLKVPKQSRKTRK